MYEDVATRYYYSHHNLKASPRARLHKLWRCSRDSARTLMQWSDGPNAGFTTGKPWFYANDNYKQINVARQDGDRDSVLNFYRLAIGLRKRLSCVRWGKYREFSKGSNGSTSIPCRTTGRKYWSSAPLVTRTGSIKRRTASIWTGGN